MTFLTYALLPRLRQVLTGTGPALSEAEVAELRDTLQSLDSLPLEARSAELWLLADTITRILLLEAQP